MLCQGFSVKVRAKGGRADDKIYRNMQMSGRDGTLPWAKGHREARKNTRQAVGFAATLSSESNQALPHIPDPRCITSQCHGGRPFAGDG
jgi:hypothetical protein